jgi:hypothetical protein
LDQEAHQLALAPGFGHNEVEAQRENGSCWYHLEIELFVVLGNAPAGLDLDPVPDLDRLVVWKFADAVEHD